MNHKLYANINLQYLTQLIYYSIGYRLIKAFININNWFHVPFS